MSSSESSDRRLIELELLVTHLQHDLEQMSSVLVGQQSQIETLKQEINRLEEQIGQLQGEPEIRDPDSERPPHY